MAMALIHAIIGSMEVSIDKAGRVVVPKPVRDRLGLRQDSKLRLVETSEGFTLTPVDRPTGLVRDEDGWLVFSGESSSKIDWDRLAEEDREERIRRGGGW
jgi:AbrB family looped-hinge helix DNA binding protein